MTTATTRAHAARTGALVSVALLGLVIAVVLAQDPDPPPMAGGPAVVNGGVAPMPMELAGTDTSTPGVPDLLRPQTQPDLPGEQPPANDAWLAQNLAELKTEGMTLEAVLTGWEWAAEPWRGQAIAARALAPDGTRVAIVDATGLTLRATAGYGALRHMPAAASATLIAFSADGRAVAIAGQPDNPARIRVFSTINGDTLGTIIAAAPVTALAMGERGGHISDGRTVWKLRGDDAPLAVTLPESPAAPSVVAMLDADADSTGAVPRSWIAVAGGIGHAAIAEVAWTDPPAIATARNIAVPGVRVNAMAIESGGELAIGASDGSVRLLPVGGGNARYVWHMAAPVTALAPMPRRPNPRFVVGSADGAMVAIVCHTADVSSHPLPLAITRTEPAAWSPVVGVAFAQQVVPGPRGARLVDYLVSLADDGAVRIHHATPHRFSRMQPATGGAVRVMAVSPIVGRQDLSPSASPVRRLVVVRDRVARVWRLPVDLAPWLENALVNLTFRPEVAGFSPDGRQIVFAAGDATEVRDAATGTLLTEQSGGDRIGRVALLVSHQRVVTAPVRDTARAPIALPGVDVHVRDSRTGGLLEAIAPFAASGTDPNETPAWRPGDAIPPAPDSAALLESGRWLLIARSATTPAAVPANGASSVALFRLADEDAARAGQPDADGGWALLRHGYLRLGAREAQVGDPPVLRIIACGNSRYLAVRRHAAGGLLLERYRPASHEEPLTIGQPGDLRADLADIATDDAGTLAAVATADGRVVVYRLDTSADAVRPAATLQLPAADADARIRVQVVDSSRVLVGTSRGALLMMHLD
ncbi:MAG: hypothetical protein AB7K09_12675 [Planctomycetota bacterium]